MSILTPSVYCYNLALCVTQSAFATRKRKSRESKITRCSHNDNTTLLLPVWTKATETYDLESTPGRLDSSFMYACIICLLHLLISLRHFSPKIQQCFHYGTTHTHRTSRRHFSHNNSDMYFVVSGRYSALDCPLLCSNKTASAAITLNHFNIIFLRHPFHIHKHNA